MSFKDTIKAVRTELRKTFKDYKQLEIWADKMDAEIIGTRTLKNGQPLNPGDNDPYMTND